MALLFSASYSGATSLSLDAPYLLAQAPVGAPPPTAPPQLFQSIGNAAGYLPKCAGWLHVTAKLSIGLSQDIGDFYTVGARDFHNGQWLSGWGKEAAPIRYDDREVAFIALHNLFNADKGGKGAIGGALGIRPVNLINGVGAAVGAVDDVIPLPPWAQKINNFTSLEAGVGYRLQNVPGVSRLETTLGGQVRVPLDLLKGL